MKWMKKCSWLLAVLAAVCLTFGVLFCFVGNPVSLILAEKGAKEYVAQQYPGLKVTRVGYDFISPRYYAEVENGEKDFFVYLNGWGEAYFDTHG